MQIIGIRHHGPGSAKRLWRALQEGRPDCILVELPADVEEVLSYAGHEGLRPPVALLVYNPKDLRQASYLPFAEFSPEWQALRYGAAEGIPVWPMDLPLGQLFSREGDRTDRQLTLRASDVEEQERIQNDPLGFLAELAGYSDSERWWEVTFEQEESDTALFSAIIDMIRTLREELRRQESDETLLREAHMRKVIRLAQSKGYARIAVVCGAWHAPALADVAHIRAAADNQRLRGLKKIKTAATWIPWTYDRLSRQSGYGAGVTSPAWYDLLFRRRGEVTVRWMSRVSRLLRQRGFEASPAQVLEAVRLADTLATLRRRSLPGLDELEEAARAVFSQGNDLVMALIHDELVIGDLMGRVPAAVPVVPLQRDLEQAIRSARLTKESETTESIRKSLDLRKDSNLAASHLLHRLHLLNIPWGKLRPGSEHKTGSFSEEWTLKWKPDFAIRIIEASALGNTVLEAATNSLLRQGAEATDLPTLSALIGTALRGDLREAIDPLILRMREQAALTRDIQLLMEALPSLATIITYGDTRQTDTEAVVQLVEEMVPRICIGLPPVAQNIDVDVARAFFPQIIAAHRAIHLLSRSDLMGDWERSLHQVRSHPGAHALVRGGVARLLFDQGALAEEATRDHLYLALSAGNAAGDAAHWMEGFLHGSGLLLIHHPALWDLIDEWVDRLSPSHFQETLPLLRRIFSRYTPAERRKMLQLAERGRAGLHDGAPEVIDAERAAHLLPTLRLLLGDDVE